MESAADRNWAGDLWGALAAMLVALPSSIAFGVAIYEPVGPARAAEGAMAGILGAAALGVVAPLFGGTRRLISSPCAPAAAVMAGLAAAMTASGALGPDQVLPLMTLAALLSAGLQVLYGFLGGGKLIKYIPYPVVTGYLSAVGLLIILGQLPKLLGLPKAASLWLGLLHPALWRGPSIALGLVTMAMVLAAPRLTKAVPPAILGFVAGILCYAGLAWAKPELRLLAGNPLVIGPIPAGSSGGLAGYFSRWAALGAASAASLKALLIPALTLSLLLSIDTLKTAVVVDTFTRSRHDSNRELVGQGLANLASALAGGVPGSGGLGVTMVNVASGGSTRLSGVLEGLLVLAAYLLLGRFVGWIPVGVLAGILLVVGARMLDRHALRLLRQRSTVLDFLVIAAVVVVALLSDLIVAAGAGLLLAMLLFVRDQIQSSVLRRRIDGDMLSSKQRRLPEEAAVLKAHGSETLVCELQGNLFFGTADQLYTELEADLKRRQFVILDLRRVQAVDLTAVHVLELIASQLEDHGGRLALSNIPRALPTGQDLRAYFREAGLVRDTSHVHVLDALDDALQWAEDRVLAREHAKGEDESAALDLSEIDLLRKAAPEVLEALRAVAAERRYARGEKIFQRGDTGDEIFLIRRGIVRIVLPLRGGGGHHLASFGRGDLFGEMAFLDRAPRSAEAAAETETELYVLSRERFDAEAKKHPWLAEHVFSRLARALALRLRQADVELRAFQES